MKKEYVIYLFIFLACVVSRMLTAVWMPEDPESLKYLRHVLSSYNQWNELSFSPLYINEVKLLMLLVKSNLAFAIAGGLATFILIIASLRLLDQPANSLSGALLVMFVFFNPMIWLFGNRYTADLTGASLVLLIIALGLRHKSKWDLYVFWIALGLLPWIKPLYFIVVLPVLIYVLFDERYKIRLGWVVVLPIGLSLVSIAIVSSLPGFNESDWLAEQSMFRLKTNDIDTMLKVLMFFKTFWVNAAGGWWTDRPFWLIFPTAVIIAPVISFLFNKTFFNSSLKEYIVLTSAILYTVIIFLVSDIYTMQSYVLPLVTIFLVITVLGIQGIFNEIESKLVYVVIGLGLLFYALNTFSLIRESKNGTAFNQLIREAEKSKVINLVVSSEPLYAMVLNNSAVITSVTYYDYQKEASMQGSGYFIADKRLPNDITKHSIITPVKIFSHDPYMNPVWPSLTLYKFVRRK